jgi:hypothetical protein
LKNQRHDDLTIETLIYQAKLQLKKQGEKQHKYFGMKLGFIERIIYKVKLLPSTLS